MTKVRDVTDVKSKNSSKDLLKQDCTIADSMGSLRIVLWESDTNKLKEGMSYRLEKVTIREYRSIKYLSLSEAGEVIEISDIIQCPIYTFHLCSLYNVLFTLFIYVHYTMSYLHFSFMFIII